MGMRFLMDINNTNVKVNVFCVQFLNNACSGKQGNHLVLINATENMWDWTSEAHINSKLMFLQMLNRWE